MDMEAKIGYIYEHFASHPNLAFSGSELDRIGQKPSGTFHHALKRLESRGHILGCRESLEGQTGKRILRYRLTSSGLAHVNGLYLDRVQEVC